MSQKKWIIFFAIMIVLMAGMYHFMKMNGESSHTVVITCENRQVLTLDLRKVKGEFGFTVINSEGGRNVIVIKDGEIYVEKADCPDGICVSHGPLKQGGTPIVCLPNRVVIRWATRAEEVDN